MLRLVRTKGLKIRTSKNALSDLSQKPSALTSSLALSSVFAVCSWKCSLSSFCKLGSRQTLWHTWERSSAVRSRISLWRWMGKAPLLQLKACSTENALPQMQLVGKKGGVQPYLRNTASLNALLCRVKPIFSTGSAVNQVEVPFFPARDTDLCWLAVRTSFRFCKSSFCLCHFSLFKTFLLSLRCCWVEVLYWVVWLMIRAAMVDVICSDISNSPGALVTGLDIPIPPMRQGKAKILRSSSLICLPINAGMNDCLMASSKGCRRSAMSGTVRSRKFHLLHSPLVRAV